MLGFLFAFGYPKHPLWVLALVIMAAPGLEALQLIEATRYGGMGDFSVKETGGGFGVSAGMGFAILTSVIRKAKVRS